MRRTRLFATTGLCIFFGVVAQCDLFAQAGVPCASEQKHEIVRHKGEHPLPAPSADKALIFAASFGQSNQHKIAIDHRRWVAVLGKSEYTFFEADPGSITLSFYGGPALWKDTALEVKANQVYVVRLNAYYIAKISQVSEQEAAELLRKLEYVTFVPKGKMTEEDWIKFDTKFQEGWQQLRTGLTPGEVHALLGEGPFVALDRNFSGSDLNGDSVTISGDVGRVYFCQQYFFEFQRFGPSPLPGLISNWKLQAWKAD
jgi:hypothetical protein